VKENSATVDREEAQMIYSLQAGGATVKIASRSGQCCAWRMRDYESQNLQCTTSSRVMYQQHRLYVLYIP